MRGNVTLVHVEAMLPQQLSSVGVEAHHAFLQCVAFTRGVLKIQPVT